MSLSTSEFNDQLREALERSDSRKRTVKQVERDDFVTYWRTQFPEAPTAEELHKHVARFGPDGVAEIKDAYELTLLNVSAAPASKAPRARRTTESMKTKVLNLHERGVVPAAIADTLNISDRRVQDILRAA